MGEVHWGGVAAVAVMYAAFLVVGWLASRKVKDGSASDLIVAGRAMPLWIATLTMTATWVDGGYLLGTAQGTFDNLALGIQGGFFFGLSLILGGLFFAKKMRRLEFTTLIDPFERRFGKRWAAVLFVPAMLGEVIWSGSLLVAIAATFEVILHLDRGTAILMSATVVTFYTMIGGMWSVAYTDIFQLALVPLGLIAALPFVLGKLGGLDHVLNQYFADKGLAAQLFPPLGTGDSYWSVPASMNWWDISLMLLLGGIPWNCYFQRVLSCQTPTRARWHSIFAGVLTILLTVPPLLLGMAALNAAEHYWPAELRDMVREHADLALPLVLRELTPYAISILGLAAIIGAVTSSFSSSILSAGSMFSWNVYRRLLVPRATVRQLQHVIRSSIVVLGAGAVVLALTVGSVQALWFFCADLIFVLLFPQLVMALYDPRANRLGSVVAFAGSLVLRLGGGEPILGLPAFLPYPEWFQGLLTGSPSEWYDSNGALLFPFRTLAAAAGLLLLPVVSRLTGRWDPPRPLE